MTYQLLAPPVSEDHAECIIHLFVRDNNSAPDPTARVKVWAGPAPTGQPAYWRDDAPFRNPGASGMLEFITMGGPMPENRDYWMQVVDNNGKALSDPIHFPFPNGKAIWLTATLQQGAPAPAQPAQPATPPPAQPAPPTPPPAASPAPAGETTYTVKGGDTLFAIARKFGVTAQDISKANNITNPSLIKPGQVLKIPKK